MKWRRAGARRGEQGVTIIETLVGLLILTVAVMGLAMTSGWAGRITATSRRDLQWWAALQWKADSLSALDPDSISRGEDVVNGYTVKWRIRRDGVRRVLVWVEGQSILNAYADVGDTLVVYLGS